MSINTEENKVCQEDWEILMSMLPENWIQQAKDLGALTRRRNIDSAQVLLRVLLIHFCEGKSLRTTAAFAGEAGLCVIRDVPLLHRMKSSERWLNWMALEMAKDLQKFDTLKLPAGKYRIRLLDGTVISEQGSTGTDWRIHFSMVLPTLACDTFIIADKSVGESLCVYPVEPLDLLIADRVFCTRKGISHVVKSKGDVLLRYHSTILPLKTRSLRPFPILERLSHLAAGEVGDWDVWVTDPDNNEPIKGRVCAIRKSEEAIAIALEKLRKTARREGRCLRPETLEHAKYVILFTTVNRHNLKKTDALRLYRFRWQIELTFKRMKSIVGVGYLPKKDPASCKAWLYGKMVVALLVERLHREAEFFSPWGYPLRNEG